MKCYGKKYGKIRECNTCSLAPYCKDAGDIPTGNNISFDEISFSENFAEQPQQNMVEENTSINQNDAQWMELVRRILYIDDMRYRIIIRAKIENPDISLSQIAKQFNTTKQNISREINNIICEYPFLKTILCNRPQYNKWRNHFNTPNSPPKRRYKRYAKIQPELF